MPNWCVNKFRIDMPKEDKEKFLAAAVKDDFELFGYFFPMPDDVFQGDLGQEEEEKYPGEKNWYGWNQANIGCKWDASDVEVTETDTGVAITCETPWGPPHIALDNLHYKLGYRVYGVFNEGGMDFAGTFINGCWEDGPALSEFGEGELPGWDDENGELDDARQEWWNKQMANRDAYFLEEMGIDTTGMSTGG